MTGGFQPPKPTDTPDDTMFVDYVAAMPGGGYIGDRWRTEPVVAVVLDVGDWHWSTQAIVTAFPPHPTGVPDRYIAVVPELAARILEWNADEYVHSVERFPLPDGTDPSAVVAVVATLIRDDGDDVEDALGVFACARLEAELAGVDADAVVAIAARLLRDDRDRPLFDADDVIAAAIDLVR